MTSISTVNSKVRKLGIFSYYIHAGDFVTEEAQYLIQEADSNGDGALNFDEMKTNSELFVGSLDSPAGSKTEL
jgi:hypothetical protein